MVTIEEIYKQVEEALKAPRKKCLVLVYKDYELLKNHFAEETGAPADINLKSFNGINVYCDNSCAFSFSMNEELYLEAKKMPPYEYFIPLKHLPNEY